MAAELIKPEKLLWIDLEFTGLDPQKDVLLEIAAEVTDLDFKTLETYEARFKQSKSVVVERMQANIWWRDFPQNRDDFIHGLDSAKPPKEVEAEMINLVERHFDGQPAYLAGNTIHTDRQFIRRWLPALELKLHYRMLDVSAWKILMQGKYGVFFEKKEVHRAFDDIQASIAELQHYLDFFKRSGGNN